MQLIYPTIQILPFQIIPYGVIIPLTNPSFENDFEFCARACQHGPNSPLALLET